MKRIITFGTFDALHIGHLRILQRARTLGDELIVGVSTDALSKAKKGRTPIFSQAERKELIAALKCVDETFFEESLEEKEKYILERKADTLVMGDDWEGTFDYLSTHCEIVYLPRTPAVSTTAIIEKIQITKIKT